MLTLKEASTITRISLRTLFRWIRAGRLQTTATGTGKGTPWLVTKFALHYAIQNRWTASQREANIVANGLVKCLGLSRVE